MIYMYSTKVANLFNQQLQQQRNLGHTFNFIERNVLRNQPINITPSSQLYFQQINIKSSSIQSISQDTKVCSLLYHILHCSSTRPK